jgi:hypothetical protein
MKHPADLTRIGNAYGLDVDEVDRALRWAAIAKTAARKGTSHARPAPVAATPGFTPGRPILAEIWCEQCDRRRKRSAVLMCQSLFCKAKDKL